MDAVWAKPEGVTPREAYDAIRTSRGKVSYRTVLTTTIRLKEYGFLTLGEKVGRTNRYLATYTREEYLHKLALETLKRLEAQFGDLALTEIRRALRATSVR